jgi:hypothetical protein
MMRKNEMHLEIEKGVPLPEARYGRPRSDLHITLSVMEVGDSFISPLSQEATNSAIQYFRRKTGRKFVTRKVDGKVRVWRFA